MWKARASRKIEEGAEIKVDVCAEKANAVPAALVELAHV